MKLYKTLITAAAIISMTALVSCGKGPAKNAAEEETTTYAVSAYKTVAGNFDDYLEFGGDVASVNAVDIMPDQAGKITNIRVSVGDMVRKGDVIAYVNPQRAGMVYQDSPVTSPISGRITAIPAQIGATVSQAYPVAKVARTDELEIKINIAERFVSRISDNQAATITLDSYPGVTFKARVSEVSPVLDTATRTMACKLRLDPPDSRVKVGMFARVKLVTKSSKNAIVVNNSSIVTRDGKPHLFVVQRPENKPAEAPSADNAKTADAEKSKAEEKKPVTTVKLQPVTLGISVDGKTEIVDGITAGEEIVIKGQTLLNDGAEVNVISVATSL